MTHTITRHRHYSSGKQYFLTALLVLLSLVSARAQMPETAVLGEWQSAKKDSRILIYRQGAGYWGKIVWGTGQSNKDEKNPDPALRSRNVIGLVILSHFIYDGTDTWKDGTIYDPRDGKTYSCKMTVKDSNSLHIRGYVGLSLFGRTDVWTKVK